MEIVPGTWNCHLRPDSQPSLLSGCHSCILHSLAWFWFLCVIEKDLPLLLSNFASFIHNPGPTITQAYFLQINVHWLSEVLTHMVEDNAHHIATNRGTCKLPWPWFQACLGGVKKNKNKRVFTPLLLKVLLVVPRLVWGWVREHGAWRETHSYPLLGCGDQEGTWLWKAVLTVR